MNILSLLKILPKLLLILPLILMVVGGMGCVTLFLNDWAKDVLKIMALLLFLGALTCIAWFGFQWFKERIAFEELKHYAFLASAFLIVFMVCALLTSIKLNNPSGLYLILSLLFFISGGIYTWLLMKKKNFKEDKKFDREIWISGFVLFLGCLLFGVVAFIIKNRPGAPIEIGIYESSTLLFLLPTFALIAFVYWGRVPELRPVPWVYIADYIPEKIILRSGEELVDCVFQVEKRDYRVKISAKQTLGDAFHLTVVDAYKLGKPITVYRQDEYGNPIYIEWYFLVQEPDSKRLRYLNPGARIQELRFKNSYKIIVKEKT